MDCGCRPLLVLERPPRARVLRAEITITSGFRPLSLWPANKTYQVPAQLNKQPTVKLRSRFFVGHSENTSL